MRESLDAVPRLGHGNEPPLPLHDDMIRILQLLYQPRVFASRISPNRILPPVWQSQVKVPFLASFGE